MTIGPENHSNGSTTAQDRFSGGVSAFRQSRREAALAAEDNDSELATRNPQDISSSQVISSQGLPTGLSSQGLSSQGLSSHGLTSQGLSAHGLSSHGLARNIEPTSALDRATSLPSLDLAGLSEPVFHPNGWMDAGAVAESMADHPLLRGLLLELPARGTMPAADWLDRWFEAARSILELLYVQEAKRS